MTRDVVIADRRVAASFWVRPFDEVLAAAHGGVDGLRAETQVTDDKGRWPICKDALMGRTGEAILIRQAGSGSCELYQQGWVDETFVPRYVTG